MAKLTPVKLREQANELLKKADEMEGKTFEQIGRLIAVTLKKESVTIAELRAKVKELLGE